MAAQVPSLGVVRRTGAALIVLLQLVVGLVQ
jgi:hypothetical protein